MKPEKIGIIWVRRLQIKGILAKVHMARAEGRTGLFLTKNL